MQFLWGLRPNAGLPTVAEADARRRMSDARLMVYLPQATLLVPRGSVSARQCIHRFRAPLTPAPAVLNVAAQATAPNLPCSSLAGGVPWAAKALPCVLRRRCSTLGSPCARLLAVARKLTASCEILLWMTPSEAPKALQASECSELLDPMRASCWISAQH